MITEDVIDPRIKKIKIFILRRKIMLNFLVSLYRKWDRIFKVFQLLAAVAAPSVGLYEQSAGGTGEKTMGVASAVLGFIVTLTVALRKFIVFDELQNTAKEQTIRYSQLLARIDLEGAREESNMDRLLVDILREYSSIRINDPVLSADDREAFQKYCIENRIPPDEDIEQIRELLEEKSDVERILAVANNNRKVSQLKRGKTSIVPKKELDICEDNSQILARLDAFR
jgi:hypothetical protein